MIKQPPMTAIARTAKILTVTIEKLESMRTKDKFYLVTENIIFENKQDAKRFQKTMNNIQKQKGKNHEPQASIMTFNYVVGGDFFMVKVFTVFQREAQAIRYKKICENYSDK